MKLEPRRDFRQLVKCFNEHELLTYASAIALQLLIALIPLFALTLVLLGRARAGDLWYERVQPVVAQRVTPEVYLAVSDAVDRVLNQTSLIWVGFAIVLTIWEVSGSVRATMGALNRMYDTRETRSIYRRFALSIVLAIGAIALVLSAFGLVAFGGWVFLPVAFVLLWAVIAMILRWAPAKGVEFRWISAGSVLVIFSWLGAFGFVAAGLLLTGYLYVSSIVFLVGAQIDEIVREDAKGGTGSGQSRRGSRPRKGQRQRRRSKASSARSRAA
jgi:membrane protein